MTGLRAGRFTQISRKKVFKLMAVNMKMQKTEKINCLIRKEQSMLPACCQLVANMLPV